MLLMEAKLEQVEPAAEAAFKVWMAELEQLAKVAQLAEEIPTQNPMELE